MARLPRLVVPHQPHLVLQHGIEPIFRDTDDYAAFLAWLREAARLFKVAVHAYVLLPGRLHLLATPADQAGLGRMMQWLGRHYVPYFNRKYGRAGTLWQGRFKAAVIDPERYFMVGSRYIELQPVLAGLAGAAPEYRWSSCAHHVGARPDPLITDHQSYWALANTPFGREAAYRALIEQALTAGEMAALSEAERKGWALGTEQFKTLLEKTGQRRVSPAKRGRPRKEAATKP